MNQNTNFLNGWSLDIILPFQSQRLLNLYFRRINYEEPLIAGDCFLALLCLNMLFKKRLVQENWMSIWMKSNQKIEISISKMLMPGHINWDTNLSRFGYILLKPYTELSLQKSHATMGFKCITKGYTVLCACFEWTFLVFPGKTSRCAGH